MRIAIFGATGYIGRSLLAECEERDLDVVPYTRDVKKANEIFANYGIKPSNTPRTYEELHGEQYDIIINASGKYFQVFKLLKILWLVFCIYLSV